MSLCSCDYQLYSVSLCSPTDLKPDHAMTHHQTGGWLLSLEQMLCHERAYVRDIPITRPNARFLVSSPARKPSFYDVSHPVGEMLVARSRGQQRDPRWSRQEPVRRRYERAPPRRPEVLRSVIYEEHLGDIMHRVMRTTYSYKVKRANLLRPRDMYSCCPPKVY